MDKMGKRIKLLLIGSLIFNVLALGIIGGHFYKRWSSHPWHEVKKDLSPETRNITGRVFQSTFREVRAFGNDARKARAELVKILSAKEFDADAFDRVTKKLVDARGEMVALKIKATRDLASQLSYEERKKMAKRMAKMVGGGHERRVKRKRKPKMINPQYTAPDAP